MIKATPRTVTRMGLTEARQNLGQLARRVHNDKEIFILEKDGIPVAGLLDVDELEDYLDLHDPEIVSSIKQAREDYLAGRTRPAEELLRELETENTKAAPKGTRRAKPKRV